MPRPYYVVLYNQNVNIRLKQMKKNNHCKVTKTSKAYIRQFSKVWEMSNTIF